MSEAEVPHMTERRDIGYNQGPLRVQFDGVDDLPEPFRSRVRDMEGVLTRAFLMWLRSAHHRREDPARSALHTAYRHKTRHR